MERAEGSPNPTPREASNGSAFMQSTIPYHTATQRTAPHRTAPYHTVIYRPHCTVRLKNYRTIPPSTVTMATSIQGRGWARNWELCNHHTPLRTGYTTITRPRAMRAADSRAHRKHNKGHSKCIYTHRRAPTLAGNIRGNVLTSKKLAAPVGAPLETYICTGNFFGDLDGNSPENLIFPKKSSTERQLRRIWGEKQNAQKGPPF